MTDDNKEDVELDEEHLPISREVTMLGIGWSFETWNKQGEEWKNNTPYQLKVAHDHMMKRYEKNRVFTEIRTGATLTISQKKDIQKIEEKILKDITVPIVWGVKGLPVRLFFFNYKLKEENKTSEK